jgi:hypothetical protein
MRHQRDRGLDIGVSHIASDTILDSRETPGVEKRTRRDTERIDRQQAIGKAIKKLEGFILSGKRKAWRKPRRGHRGHHELQGKLRERTASPPIEEKHLAVSACR